MRTRTKLAIAGGLSRAVVAGRRAVGRTPVVRARRGDLNWELDLEEGIDFAIYLLGSFEPSLQRFYRRLVRPGSTVLDIGANVGAHALPLAKCVGPGGRVVAFEATEFAMQKLLRNLELNPGLEAVVRPVHTVLSDREGDAAAEPPIFASWPLRPHRGVDPLHGGIPKEVGAATALTLDAALEDSDVRAVKLVKMDVDGAEPRVLAGATRTLERYRPTLAMEIAPHALEDRDSSLEELLDVLDSLDYRIRDLAGRSLPMEADRLRALVGEGATANVLAEPVARSMGTDPHAAEERSR